MKKKTHDKTYKQISDEQQASDKYLLLVGVAIGFILILLSGLAN